MNIGNNKASRPVPSPSSETRPFWAAAAKAALELPYCARCARYAYPPPPRCPICLDADLVWRSLSGRARLKGWTMVGVDVLPGVTPPFIVAEAGPDEQPELAIIAHIVGIPANRLAVDMPLRIVFVPTDDPAIALPEFHLADAAAA